jgi:predicted Zn finger-like uncharacterized protein
MRISCPNCDAQYEVAEDAIPPAGRDVQCSNCGHAWFQPAPRAAAEEAEEARLFGDALAAEAAAPAPAGVFPPEGDPPPLPDAPPDPPGPAPAPPAPAPAASPVAEGAAASQRRTLDDSLMAVLREEAEREAAARRAEAARGIEVQPDLGLDSAAAGPALSPTQRKLAMLKGRDPDAAPPAPPRPMARRDLLPDVEEINSTLRAAGTPEAAEEGAEPSEDEPAPRRSGFRSGFALMLLVALMLGAAYAAAPRLSAQIPALAPALATYVERIDHVRLWIDGLMRSATERLEGQG